MDRTRLEAAPGVWLDARRAVWLEHERILAVADLHLGYAWAHRHSGNLLPLSAPDDTSSRLVQLVEACEAREVVLVGDIVHRAVRVAPLRSLLRDLCDALGGSAVLRLVAGNHDAKLAPLLRECGIDAQLHQTFRAGPHLFAHGDAAENVAREQLADAAKSGGFVFIGHEHPAITISDRVATRAKCPCFLVHPQLVVLPAFSRWAAGTAIGSGEPLSAYVAVTRFDRAVAIVADKLMPVPLRKAAP